MLFLTVTMVLTLIACGKSVQQQVAEQLELGQRYLTEMNYEEAIVAFQKVIKLDDRNVEAYLGLSDTYVAIDDKENAMVILEMGYEKTQDERLEEKLEHLKSSMNPKQEESIKETEITKETNLEESEGSDKREVPEEYQGFIENLIEMLRADDLEQVYEAMESSDYQKLQEFVAEKGNLVVDGEDGKDVGFYMKGDICMIYYGDYQNGLCQGNGIWLGILANGRNRYVARGQWFGDKPNGSQEVRLKWKFEKGGTPRNHTIDYGYIGTVIDGIWNGKAQRVVYMNVDSNGERNPEHEGVFDVSFTNGYYDIIDYEGESYIGVGQDGKPVLSLPIDANEEPKGILGFGNYV